jgi:hypothetical protein
MSFDSFNGLTGNSKSERKLNDEYDQGKIFTSLLRKNSHYTNGPGQNSRNCSHDELDVELPTTKADHFVRNKTLLGKSGSSDLLVDKRPLYDDQILREEKPIISQLKKLPSESHLTQATLDDHEFGLSSGQKTAFKFQFGQSGVSSPLDEKIASLTDAERRSLHQVSLAADIARV